MAHSDPCRFDPYDWATQDDPYPQYAAMREREPAYYNPERDFFALSRHADVLAGFRDPQRFSNTYGVSIDPASWGPHAHLYKSFLAMDPPAHTRMRALVSRGFTPRRVASLESRLREITCGYLDALIGSGGFDFIDEVAGRIPMDVISELLGVPAEDRSELRRRADLLVHRKDGVEDVPQEGIEAFAWIRAYFQDVVKRRRARPGDDLLSALLATEIDGERLADDDLLSFANLMIVAGNETTTKLLANALYWLWRNPEERALVRTGDVSIAEWVEETLRYDNSTQSLARRAAQGFELHGVSIPEGARILLLVGSANRDERVFPNPAVFDLRRDTSHSLAFGQGTHFCMGASLARLEGRVVLEEWQRRFADYEIDPDGAVRVHSINVRGFAHLPVKV
jgi:cytochrome P450